MTGLLGAASGFCMVWIMFAATAARIDADDPLAGLELGERPDPVAPDGWVTVTVKAAALNHHDVWTLRGVGIAADCLPTAYLTAYKMLFDKSGVQPGATVLVQGAGGGVATALIVLGRAAGYRMWATSRGEAKRERALKLGADQVFPTGARLPERVDVVMETVGQATWAHSVRSLKPGGRIVVAGATSGDAPPGGLSRVFFTQLTVTGSTMGSRDQLGRLARFCEQTGVRPVIDRVLPLAQARDGFAAMISGDLFGKIVFTL